MSLELAKYITAMYVHFRVDITEKTVKDQIISYTRILKNYPINIIKKNIEMQILTFVPRYKGDIPAIKNLIQDDLSDAQIEIKWEQFKIYLKNRTEKDDLPNWAILPMQILKQRWREAKDFQEFEYNKKSFASLLREKQEIEQFNQLKASNQSLIA